MSRFLLIETRDPFESADVFRTFELAASLVRERNTVTVLLVENGVFAARESAVSGQVALLARAGVTVLADDFSLKERGIDPGRLVPVVSPSSLDVVIDHLAGGHKVLWH
ncbi:DsrE family protein [Vitiosangium sp. GDMCC 1.1324]|uniref:DsrE family protein n=1 Tax=Vitiosangium sp. (strain GDMCC 1.1324) TaxID=2138576 RepID=UPI000D3C574F|nr:DsrE family protein [Vitiosangium sp. GDMCC 1.1324]PTL79849.1 sulfur reduction protein DsrE [Vitiosangium sp. GDMCC 1.1324]